MSSLMISISGVRGIIGESLTPELVMRLGAAFGTYTESGRVVVGRDTRVSGEMVKHSVLAGLLSSGCSIIDLGVVTTPTAAVMVEELGADGGIVISASHNPIEWNALKFFTSEVMYLSAEQGRALLDIYYQGEFTRARWNQIREVETDDSADGVHLDRVLKLVDVQAIRARKFRVALDSCNGAGVEITARLLKELGCQPIRIHCTPDGLFPHDPEPSFVNLQDLCGLAAEQDVDVGFAQDPDADRLAVVNESGVFLGEEYTLALAAEHVLSSKTGKVVVNMSTSRVVADVAARHGCECERVPVGEVNVALRMREIGAVIGGEGNGGVIDPRAHYGRDSLVGMGLILEMMAARGEPLSALVAKLPRYFMHKTKTDCGRGRVSAALKTLRTEAEREGSATIDVQDGLRLDWPDRWVHVRASNTEPVVRIIAESAEEDGARSLAEAYLEKVRRLAAEKAK